MKRPYRVEYEVLFKGFAIVLASNEDEAREIFDDRMEDNAHPFDVPQARDEIVVVDTTNVEPGGVGAEVEIR